MPRTVIIPSENRISIDNQILSIDCTGIPKFIQTVQWDGAKGHIEFAPDEFGKQLSNLPITNLAPFMYLIDRWNEERDRLRKVEEETRKEMEAKDGHAS